MSIYRKKTEKSRFNPNTYSDTILFTQWTMAIIQSEEKKKTRTEKKNICTVKIVETSSPTSVTEPLAQKVQPPSSQQDTDPCFPVQQVQQCHARLRQCCANYGSNKQQDSAPDYPAWGQTLSNCNMLNHYAKWCRSAPGAAPAQEPHPALATIHTVLSNPTENNAIMVLEQCCPGRHFQFHSILL